MLRVLSHEEWGVLGHGPYRFFEMGTPAFGDGCSARQNGGLHQMIWQHRLVQTQANAEIVFVYIHLDSARWLEWPAAAHDGLRPPFTREDVVQTIKAVDVIFAIGWVEPDHHVETVLQDARERRGEIMSYELNHDCGDIRCLGSDLSTPAHNSSHLWVGIRMKREDFVLITLLVR